MVHAAAARRPGLHALFALDERLGGVVGTTAEPGIGLIRLAWWREALERLDAAPPPAEPLLAALAAHALPHGVAGATLAGLEDGWAALLDGEPDAAALARHGAARGGGLFAAAAVLLGGDPSPAVRAAGTGWALADLAHRHSGPAVRAAARARAVAALRDAPVRWPAPLRPLGALAVLARADAAAPARTQGGPGRVARMLAMRLTGR